MRGIVNNFVEEKGFGFIDGEDGQSYFLHISELHDDQRGAMPTPGMMVEFDATPTPKGLRAKSATVLDDRKAMTYEAPDRFLTFKNSVPSGWVVIEEAQWKVGCEHADLDRAKDDMIRKAESVGANAITEMAYSKRRGSSGTAGGGTYYFTLHCFEGRPVNIGKPRVNGTQGDSLVKDLDGKCKIEHANQVATGRGLLAFRILALLMTIALLINVYSGPGFFGLVLFALFTIVLFKITSHDGPKLYRAPTGSDKGKSKGSASR